MKTEWDYTALADAYLKRPDYSRQALGTLLRQSGAQAGDAVCDVGAGVGHLTLHLAAAGFAVTAIEPNDAMRANGMQRTRAYGNVVWLEATGERTGLSSDTFALVTFGSSFNVTDQQAALAESARILRPGGMFACMWNHRQLNDPIQERIESIIKESIPGYGYGSRRQDQTEVIDRCGLFGKVAKIEGDVVHEVEIDDVIEAWRSHATLMRQAGDKFQEIVKAIETYLRGLGTKTIMVPYTTRIWSARRY